MTTSEKGLLVSIYRDMLLRNRSVSGSPAGFHTKDFRDGFRTAVSFLIDAVYEADVKRKGQGRAHREPGLDVLDAVIDEDHDIALAEDAARFLKNHVVVTVVR